MKYVAIALLIVGVILLIPGVLLCWIALSLEVWHETSMVSRVTNRLCVTRTVPWSVLREAQSSLRCVPSVHGAKPATATWSCCPQQCWFQHSSPRRSGCLLDDRSPPGSLTGRFFSTQKAPTMGLSTTVIEQVLFFRTHSYYTVHHESLHLRHMDRRYPGSKDEQCHLHRILGLSGVGFYTAQHDAQCTVFVWPRNLIHGCSSIAMFLA